MELLYLHIFLSIAVFIGLVGLKVKVKVNFTLEQAMKAQRESSVTAVLFL
jgi:hypothetical protein